MTSRSARRRCAALRCQRRNPRERNGWGWLAACVCACGWLAMKILENSGLASALADDDSPTATPGLPTFPSDQTDCSQSLLAISVGSGSYSWLARNFFTKKGGKIKIFDQANFELKIG